MNLQYVMTVEEGGQQFVLMLDTDRGVMIKYPVETVGAAPEVPHTRIVHAAVSVEPKSTGKIPAVFSAPRITAPDAEEIAEEVGDVIEPEGPKKNPHATARPQYAWQDENWVPPEERRKRPPQPSPKLGSQTLNIFKDPGKFGDNVDYTPHG